MLRQLGLRLCMRQTLMQGMQGMTPSKDDVKRQKTMDDVLKDVLDEALAARDRGERPDTDFVYKRTQEKMYEAEHGRPPPSKATVYLNHIPPEPRDDVRRLLPYALFEDDPWPQPSVSAFKETWKFSNDVYGAGGNGVTADSGDATAKSGDDLIGDFSDAADEVGHWEMAYLDFLRRHSAGHRRALPLLVEDYKVLTHRLIRAERRFLATRDRAVGKGLKLDPSIYSEMEDIVERIRKTYTETHKTLTQATYDPTNMNKAVTGKLLKMSDEEYRDWLDEARAQRNRIMSAFEEAPIVTEVEAEDVSHRGGDTPEEFGLRLDRVAAADGGAAQPPPGISGYEPA